MLTGATGTDDHVVSMRATDLGAYGVSPLDCGNRTAGQTSRISVGFYRTESERVQHCVCGCERPVIG